MNKSKQVIVMRKSFVIDGKKITPRKGKMISQGSHASLKAILDYGYITGEIDDLGFTIDLKENSALKDWLTGSFTKVCCVVETEEEIVALYNKAKEKGLMCSLIQDAGLTEFGGVPTITCCAIGPAWSDEVDEITGKLELF
jgi:PTH2 family peptidyl-tRNA hydrolase